MDHGAGFVLAGVLLLAAVPVCLVLVETASRFFWFNRVRDALVRMEGLTGGGWDGSAYVYSGRVGGLSVRVRLLEDRLLATVLCSRFHFPAGLELRADEGGAWSGSGDRTVPALLTGDPAFDAAWRIVPRRPVLPPTLDARVLELLVKHRQPGLVIAEETLAVVSRIPGDRRRAVEAPGRLLALAQALDAHANAREAV